MSVVSLPAPAEYPDADVVIYDGHCRFCTSQVQRLAQWGKNGRLTFISLHDPEVARRFPDLTYQQMMDQLWIVEPSGRKHGGAAAFRYLTRKLKRLWPLAPLMHIPLSLPVWQRLYREIAKRRYRWGKTPACDGDVCSIHFR